MLKLDLHTHSVASPDGGITEKEYREIIAKNVLDVVAITDHNTIDFAKRLQAKLGEHIIVGEEIMTQEGEVIGLFLSVEVTPQQTIAQTVQAIHKQKGLVYIPHPFDAMRKGIGKKNLLKILDEVDIIEGFNGRMIWRKRNEEAAAFIQQYNKIFGIGSDAHRVGGLGKAYASIEGKVGALSLKRQVQQATHVTHYQPWYEYLGPTWNKLKKFFNFSSPYRRRRG